MSAIYLYINKVVVHGKIVEFLFNINVSNKNDDGVEPLMSNKDIKTLQRKYKFSIARNVFKWPVYIALRKE